MGKDWALSGIFIVCRKNEHFQEPGVQIIVLKKKKISITS